MTVRTRGRQHRRPWRAFARERDEGEMQRGFRGDRAFSHAKGGAADM